MDLADLPGNPIPPGTELVPIEAADGVALRAARFPALREPARGTVVLFQGRGEQIEKYFAVVEALRRRGFAVAAFDWRGQGGSARLTRDPRRHHVRRFSDYEADIRAVRERLVLPACPAPYFGLAHSMGALILLWSSPRLAPFLSRMVLASPFFDFYATPMPRPTIRRITGLAAALGLGRRPLPARYARRVAVRAFEGNPLTGDAANFERMMALTAARPDLGIGPSTMRWTHEVCRAIDAIEADDFPATVRIPSLLLNAGDDRLVSPRAVETMARRLRNAGYVLVPGARHELMMERGRIAAQFWAAFDAFVPGSADHHADEPV